MAELIANITEDTGELEVSAVSVASSIVEQLTIAAIEQPEVCTNVSPVYEILVGLFYQCRFETAILKPLTI